MGEAKRRKLQIDSLRTKQRAPKIAKVQRPFPPQSRKDLDAVEHGIDARIPNYVHVAAMARLLYALFEEAKQRGLIDEPVGFLYSKWAATVSSFFSEVPLACARGCSHCCHVTVSVSGPEALFIAKKLRRHAISRVKAAYLDTKDQDFTARNQHAYPCPLLEQDLCSIYDARPMSCRTATSTDAGACYRVYRMLSAEEIQVPTWYMSGRNHYGLAVRAALRRANLPDHAYELNAALAVALDTQDAERAWLSGRDIFAHVLRETTSAQLERDIQLMASLIR